MQKRPPQIIDPATLTDLRAAKADALAAGDQAAVCAIQLSEQAALAANSGRLDEAARLLDGALVHAADVRVLFLGFQFFFRTSVADGVDPAARAAGLDRAEQLVRRRLAIAEQRGDALSSARAHTNLGLVLHYKGELGEAERHYVLAVEIDRRIGYDLGVARDLGNLGNFYETRAAPPDAADLDRAEALYHEALSLAERLGDQGREIAAGRLAALGDVAATRGSLELARARWRQALELFTALSIEKWRAYCEAKLAETRPV